MTAPAFSAAIVHGLLVTVTPDGWALRQHGKLIATGRERGALGTRAALAAAAIALHTPTAAQAAGVRP